jgi:hypothetical protein
MEKWQVLNMRGDRARWGGSVVILDMRDELEFS